MQTTAFPSAVNTTLTPLHLSYAAVREDRAWWLSSRPIDACAAVEVGDASWMWDRPVTIIMDETEPVEPCPCPWYDPSGPTPWDEPVAAFEPSEADLEDYIEWARERDERLWRERIDAGPTFIEKLTAIANAFLDHHDEDICGLGGWIAEVADEARSLEARTWANYSDRRDAMLDAQR